MERIRGLLARCLAVLVAPLLVLGVMVPAASAARGPDRPAGWSEQAELSGPNGEFGQSVAVSATGTTALVGAPNLNTGAGAAPSGQPRRSPLRGHGARRRNPAPHV